MDLITTLHQRFANISTRQIAAGCVLILAILALIAWAVRVEPTSRMTVGLRAVDAIRGTAVLVLTNATTDPASIYLKSVEQLSNGLWIASSSDREDRGKMHLHADGTLAVRVRAPADSAWRVRFTSIEKKPGMSTLELRIRRLLGLGDGSHHVDVISEQIPPVPQSPMADE
jgi:hypothetical protein